MNATELIAKAATHAGWTQQKQEMFGSRLTERYAKDQNYLLITYKLFGAVTNYMLRYYGKDERSGINWGIETAHIKALIEIEGGHTSWTTTQVFEGKDKKRQVLRYLRSSADGSA